MSQIWIDEIMALQHHSYPSLGRRLSDGEITLAMLAVAQYDIALGWLVRWRWKSDHQLPVSLTLAAPFKPLAEVLKAISYMCWELHGSQEAVATRISYPHAAAWFRSVYWEMVCAEIERSMTPIYVSDERKKRRVAEGWLEDLRSLKSFQNPVTAADQMPATLVLFDAAINLAQRPKSCFNREYYQPFLKAVAADIKAKSGVGWSCTYLDESGQPYTQTGKGKGRRKIPIPSRVRELNAESTAG